MMFDDENQRFPSNVVLLTCYIYSKFDDNKFYDEE